jgi:hypothetical protein
MREVLKMLDIDRKMKNIYEMIHKDYVKLSESLCVGQKVIYIDYKTKEERWGIVTKISECSFNRNNGGRDTCGYCCGKIGIDGSDPECWLIGRDFGVNAGIVSIVPEDFFDEKEFQI